jgi:hypothetical protein
MSAKSIWVEGAVCAKEEGRASGGEECPYIRLS